MQAKEILMNKLNIMINMNWSQVSPSQKLIITKMGQNLPTRKAWDQVGRFLKKRTRMDTKKYSLRHMEVDLMLGVEEMVLVETIDYKGSNPTKEMKEWIVDGMVMDEEHEWNGQNDWDDGARCGWNCSGYEDGFGPREGD